MTDRSREPAAGFEPTLAAFVATCGLSLVFVHVAALIVRAALGRPSPLHSTALTWTMAAVAALFATAHLALWERKVLIWAGAALSLGGAIWLLATRSGAWPDAVALAVVGLAQGQAEIRLARALAPSLSGAWRRRPVLSALWAVLAVLFLIQDGRLSAYMADPSVDWWLTTRNEFWSKHMCMPAYIEAADLQRQGVANVYSAEYYPAVTRSAKPHLTVENLEAYASDPFQYPPQFLLLPHLALKLTNDFLTLRTVWFALQIAGFALVAYALCAWIGGGVGKAAALLIPAVWVSVPMMQSLQYGQFHLAALVLAIGGMLAFEKRRHALGGALLAAATLAKISPGLLLVYLLMGRRWRAAAWTVGCVAGFSLLALLVLGPAPFRAFVEYQVPRMQSGEAFDFAKDYPEYREVLIADNFSPAAFVSKLRELGAPLAAPRVGGLAQAGYAMLLLLVSGVAGAKDGSRRHRACAWLAVLNLAALQSPGAWADYVTLGSVWLLALYPDLFVAHPRRAAFLAAGWVFFAFVPGVPPVPTSLPIPAMMVLTVAGTLLMISFNLWAIFRAEAPGSLEASA